MAASGLSGDSHYLRAKGTHVSAKHTQKQVPEQRVDGLSQSWSRVHTNSEMQSVHGTTRTSSLVASLPHCAYSLRASGRQLRLLSPLCPACRLMCCSSSWRYLLICLHNSLYLPCRFFFPPPFPTPFLPFFQFPNTR